MILSDKLRILSANRSFYRMFGLKSAQIEGERLFELGHGEWNVPELKQLLENVAGKDKSFKDKKITADFPRLGRRTLRLNGRRLLGERDDMRLLLVIEDVSEE